MVNFLAKQMSASRKICIVTGSRAEYGLLYWLMKEIQQDQELNLQIIVTGMHLATEFGLTFKIIEEDGFIINEKVVSLLPNDSSVGISKSLGLGIIGLADSLHRLAPDLLVILGDRFEVLAAAQAAMIARIPIAHIHGGEATEGVIDEAIRHSITKMAHLHFVTCECYRKRVIQLGEHPDHVINVGAPGLDYIQKLTLIGKKDLEESLQFGFGPTNFLVTYHPVTLNKDGPQKPVMELLKALDCFSNARIIFTKSNADTDGRIIHELIDDYVSHRSDKAIHVISLGQQRYLSLMHYVDVVIGNSSSGIIEAPAMKKATVNMGKRQEGRLKTTSIIDCNETEECIVKAIQKALSSHFQDQLSNTISLYGDGHSSYKIKEHLKHVDLTHILMKKFYEIDWK